MFTKVNEHDNNCVTRLNPWLGCATDQLKHTHLNKILTVIEISVMHDYRRHE